MRTHSPRRRPESFLVYLFFLSLIVFESMSLHYVRSRAISNTLGDSGNKKKAVASEQAQKSDISMSTQNSVRLREKMEQVIEKLARENGWIFFENPMYGQVMARARSYNENSRTIEKNIYLSSTKQGITLEKLGKYAGIVKNYPELMALGLEIIGISWAQIGDDPIMQLQIGTYEPKVILGNIRFLVKSQENPFAIKKWGLIPRQSMAYGSFGLNKLKIFPKARSHIDTDLLKEKSGSYIQGTKPEVPVSPTRKPGRSKAPRIAIVIDDIGFVLKPTEDFFSIKSPITFAVLPGGKFSQIHAREAVNRGYEVILHLPLEPLDESVNPGPGLIRSSMTTSEVWRQLKDNIESIPGIIGVNNHMGSKGTQDPILMDLVMKGLKEEGLFFIDSRTVADSIAWKIAVENEVPSTVRDVFIDHYGVHGIEGQMELLLNKALENGSAIGIAHARPGVAKAIADFLPRFAAAGIKIVPVSELVK